MVINHTHAEQGGGLLPPKNHIVSAAACGQAALHLFHGENHEFYFQSSVTASPCHLLCQRRLILPWLSVCIISRNAEDGVPYRSSIFTVKFVMRINDKNISVQSRAGACSRQKIASFPRRLVGMYSVIT